MPDLPSHPNSGADDAARPSPDSRPPGARRLWTVIAVLVIALVALIIVLHVTGVVGAGTNG